LRGLKNHRRVNGEAEGGRNARRTLDTLLQSTLARGEISGPHSSPTPGLVLYRWRMSESKKMSRGFAAMTEARGVLPVPTTVTAPCVSLPLE
jgi:hypothetical protein